MEAAVTILEAKLGSVPDLKGKSSHAAEDEQDQMKPEHQNQPERQNDPEEQVTDDAVNESRGVSLVRICDHPAYSAYFRMLRVGVPAQAIKTKMSREGKDPGILDRDPEDTIEMDEGLAAEDGNISSSEVSEDSDFSD